MPSSAPTKKPQKARRLNRYALAEIRESRELTKTEAAQGLGVSLQLYCDLESGHRDATPAMLGKLADLLKCRKLALMARPDELDTESAVAS